MSRSSSPPVRGTSPGTARSSPRAGPHGGVWVGGRPCPSPAGPGGDVCVSRGPCPPLPCPTAGGGPWCPRRAPRRGRSPPPGAYGGGGGGEGEDTSPTRGGRLWRQSPPLVRAPQPITARTLPTDRSTEPIQSKSPPLPSSTANHPSPCRQRCAHPSAAPPTNSEADSE